MKYTTEIFETLSRGKFISSNSLDKAQRNWYDDIDDNYQEYFDFFIKIGYKLERGNGYCFFTRQMAKVDIESKIKSLMKWIDYLAFLKSYNSIFGPGFSFTKGAPVMKIESRVNPRFAKAQAEGEDLLFDLQADPAQQHQMENADKKAELLDAMARLCAENDAPDEVYERFGLKKPER